MQIQRSQRGLTLACEGLKGALTVPKEQKSHSSKHSRQPDHSKPCPFASPQRLVWKVHLVSGGRHGMTGRCPVLPFLLLSVREKWATCPNVVFWCTHVYHPACCISSHHTIAGLFALHLRYPKGACHFCSGIKTPQCLPNLRWRLSDYFSVLSFSTSNVLNEWGCN